jgi:hypothetical protein
VDRRSSPRCARCAWALQIPYATHGHGTGRWRGHSHLFPEPLLQARLLGVVLSSSPTALTTNSCAERPWPDRSGATMRKRRDLQLAATSPDAGRGQRGARLRSSQIGLDRTRNLKRRGWLTVCSPLTAEILDCRASRAASAQAQLAPFPREATSLLPRGALAEANRGKSACSRWPSSP